MPKLYVGTYAKYNAGSIKGQWVDLEDFAGNRDGFYEHCAAIHNDESDPEFMFQDFEGFPRRYYNESDAPEALFDWLDLDDYDREILEIYVDNVDESGDIEAAKDAFQGKADSEADFAANWLEDCGMLAEVPHTLRSYIDFEAYARDMRHEGVCFVRHKGEVWVFNPC